MRARRRPVQRVPVERPKPRDLHARSLQIVGPRRREFLTSRMRRAAAALAPSHVRAPRGTSPSSPQRHLASRNTSELSPFVGPSECPPRAAGTPLRLRAPRPRCRSRSSFPRTALWFDRRVSRERPGSLSSPIASTRRTGVPRVTVRHPYEREREDHQHTERGGKPLDYPNHGTTVDVRRFYLTPTLKRRGCSTRIELRKSAIPTPRRHDRIDSLGSSARRKSRRAHRRFTSWPGRRGGCALRWLSVARQSC